MTSGRDYGEYLILTEKLTRELNDPLPPASVMLAQALSLYKTLMTEEDFDKLLHELIERKDDIQKFDHDSRILN